MQDHRKHATAWSVDALRIELYTSRIEMGFAAAECFAEAYQSLRKESRTLNVVFAAAPSQNEFLEALVARSDIEWRDIHAFHMDEYVGLPADDPRRFSRYLDDHLFSHVECGEVNYIDPGGEEPADVLADRYSWLLQERRIHITCMGIGENGHIAFNDPPVADFRDSRMVKLVELDPACRLQQVHDGCFDSIDDVPTHALTMTIPALMRSKHVICVVPGRAKRAAVKRTLTGPIDVACPASILRTHQRAKLFLDEESATELRRLGSIPS